MYIFYFVIAKSFLCFFNYLNLVLVSCRIAIFLILLILYSLLASLLFSNFFRLGNYALGVIGGIQINILFVLLLLFNYNFY